MATQATPEISPLVPALGPEHAVVWPKRTRLTLKNGLEVVLAESHNIPKFTGELYFRSGNAATALDVPGLAEITANVLRTATTSRTSRQIEEALRRMGADLSTAAGADNSAISFSGLTEFSGDLLTLVAELAQSALFPEDEFERERRQTLEGLRLERTTPSFLASERLRHVLFGAHPYAVVSPTEAQVESYQRSQLVDFYRAHYRPANALLVIAGDFASGEMMAEIERIFGGWNGAEAPPTPYQFSEDFDSPRLDPRLLTLRLHADPSWLDLRARPGHLRLLGQQSLASAHRQSLVAHRQTALHATARTVLDFRPEHPQQMAGLAHFYNTKLWHYLHLTWDERLGQRVLRLGSLNFQTYTESALVPVPDDVPIHLRAETNGRHVTFAWSPDPAGPAPAAWIPIGPSLDASLLSDEYATRSVSDRITDWGYTGAVFALAAQDLTSARLHADFELFEYREVQREA